MAPKMSETRFVIYFLSLSFFPLSLRAEQNAICLTLLASLDDAFAPVMDLQGRDFVSPVPFLP